MKNTLVAVYGTLRQDFGNHRVLNGSKLVDAGWTANKYQLSADGIPYVHPEKEVSKVRVEVYEVTPENLPMVDRLEGYDPSNHEGSWYKRTPIPVKLDNGKEVEASIYFNNSVGSTIIESGDYNDYRR